MNGILVFYKNKRKRKNKKADQKGDKQTPTSNEFNILFLGSEEGSCL